MFVSISLACGHEIMIDYKFIKGKNARLEAWFNGDNDKGIAVIKCPYCDYVVRGE